MQFSIVKKQFLHALSTSKKINSFNIYFPSANDIQTLPRKQDFSRRSSWSRRKRLYKGNAPYSSSFLSFYTGTNVIQSGIALWLIWVIGLAVSLPRILPTLSPLMEEGCWETALMLCQPCAAGAKPGVCFQFLSVSQGKALGGLLWEHEKPEKHPVMAFLKDSLSSWFLRL